MIETRNNVNRNQIGSLPAPEIRNPFKVCGENSELLTFIYKYVIFLSECKIKKKIWNNQCS